MVELGELFALWALIFYKVVSHWLRLGVLLLLVKLLLRSVVYLIL